jgi:hypothetical protein
MSDGLDFLQPTDAARARAFERTLGVVRRRRWTRRAGAVLLVAAAYAAGFASHAFFPRASEAGHADPSPASQPLAGPLKPADLEARAGARHSAAEQAILLKAAGDRYLNELGDVEAALRCYRKLLKLATSDERTHFDPADTWLLAALKRGADQEKPR